MPTHLVIMFAPGSWCEPVRRAPDRTVSYIASCAIVSSSTLGFSIGTFCSATWSWWSSTGCSTPRATTPTCSLLLAESCLVLASSATTPTPPRAARRHLQGLLISGVRRHRRARGLRVRHPRRRAMASPSSLDRALKVA
jgi:hypothetical protein